MAPAALLPILLAPSAAAAPPCYRAVHTEVDPRPVLSWMGGNSAFGQVFNPSWIEASPDGSVKPGLIVRTQNCTVDGAGVPGGCGLPGAPASAPRTSGARHGCCGCNMRNASDSLQKRSILTFSPLGAGGDGSTVRAPQFSPLTAESVVFAPVDKPPLNDDFRGTEDPRVALDPKTGVYYMFYTCFHKGTYRNPADPEGPAVSGGSLCLASTKNPTRTDGWTRKSARAPRCWAFCG